MIEDMEHLSTGCSQYGLLCRYRDAAAGDRQAWLDRVQELGGVTGRDLVRLHGELLAYGWLEQNTGATPAGTGGGAPACYRVTPAGMRALRQARDAEPAPA
jgi:hypothetical protein